MVKFGERLPTLMVAAWKDKYIDYERLKAMLEDGALDAAASSAYKELGGDRQGRRSWRSGATSCAPGSTGRRR